MTDENGVAHHGPPVLTEREASICLAMAEWIRVVRKERATLEGSEWLPSRVDIIKSRLFWRLRSGKRPLLVPPPTAYSCPWYELIEESDRPHWAYEVREWEGSAYIAQDRYEIVDRATDGSLSVVRFGPWLFRVWVGENNGINGWWIQVTI